jgi:hypothetical protein
MRRFLITMMKVILLGLLCSGVLVSCNDDDNNQKSTITSAIGNSDPSYGFLLNSTPYLLKIDLGEEETFTIELNPGMLLGMHLKENKTYVLHVVILNNVGRVVSEYVNSFYIDAVPLDNQLEDFICSWYVEFTPTFPETGFVNKFGT